MQSNPKQQAGRLNKADMKGGDRENKNLVVWLISLWISVSKGAVGEKNQERLSLIIYGGRRK
jgi:hypothetical protein